jgi:hypothetical protein
MLRPTDKIIAGIEIKQLMYLFLLGKVEKKGDTVWSIYTKQDCLFYFKRFDNVEVKQAFADLLDMEAIAVSQTGDIAVGYVENKQMCLYTAEAPADLEREVAVMVEYANRYAIALRRKGKEYVADSLIEEFREICNKRSVMLQEVMTAFRLVYELVNQEAYREFTGQELGLIKKLVELYSPGEVIKMMVLCATDTTIPVFSITSLYNMKDKVKSKITKQTQKEDLRHGKQSTGF